MLFSASVRTFLYKNRNHPVLPPIGPNYVRRAVGGREFGTSTFYLFSTFLENSSLRNAFLSQLRNFESHRSVLQRNLTFQWFKSEMAKIRTFLKNHSFHIVRTCTQQCECVVAHRIRRAQQIFSLYTGLWDEVALREFGRRLRQQLTRKGKELFLSAVGVCAFDWDRDRIPNEEMLRYTAELEETSNLFETRKKRSVCSCPDKNCCECSCSGSIPGSTEAVRSDWLPFIEEDDVLIWRKQEDKMRGLYAYKVYGKYNDVSAQAFLQAQIDTDYRKEWDNTAVTLKIIDSEPTSNSDVIYWEMQWPKLFSNRDYVFNRRYMVCIEKNVIIIVNKCVEHPGCPEKPENHRVKEYWSYMVIKPFTHFNEPGIEFVLTYFDNPGVSIPSALSAWVAMTGLPDFLSRLRAAARELASRATVVKADTPVETNNLQGTEEIVDRNNFFQKLNAARLFL
ncbi:stAR-related lipid transfer protein 7, mitochondrial isoform X1 [Schistocerca serialis cubense]|uniref:stAR-related lipid transfer protein 7, mitochondrial isoform X1 n=1 Tax=Schistocerca serialis cubense TaxID=2023355 RepID=UPI00214EFCE1|nr:stAR-related lipid transfer protein 7, mitochondrial isoform X1 [Schistocerca serialis cubense]